MGFDQAKAVVTPSSPKPLHPQGAELNETKLSDSLCAVSSTTGASQHPKVTNKSSITSSDCSSLTHSTFTPSTASRTNQVLPISSNTLVSKQEFRVNDSADKKLSVDQNHVAAVVASVGDSTFSSQDEEIHRSGNPHNFFQFAFCRKSKHIFA